MLETIEVGKKYITRDGDIAECVYRRKNSEPDEHCSLFVITNEIGDDDTTVWTFKNGRIKLEHICLRDILLGQEALDKINEITAITELKRIALGLEP